MAYHPVPMLTINKLTNALKSIANCLDEAKVPNTLADAKYSMMIAEMIARGTLDDTAAEIHSIKTGEPLEVLGI
jgi:hypothetical protein